jgi:hypothetical protein
MQWYIQASKVNERDLYNIHCALYVRPILWGWLVYVDTLLYIDYGMHTCNVKQ